MPFIERGVMVRCFSFGTVATLRICSARRKARRRSKMSPVGQLRWRCVRFGSWGSFDSSGEGGVVGRGVMGKVMVRWRHCSASLFSVEYLGAGRKIIGNSMWRFARGGGLPVETQALVSRDTRRRERREALGRRERRWVAQ